MRWMTGLALAGIGGCWVGGGDDQWTFDAASAVEVDLGSGDVRIGSSADSSVWVSWDGGGVGKGARPDVYQDASGEVRVNARTLLGSADIDVLAPAGAPLDVLVDRGSVSIELAQGADIDVCVGAGDVSIGVPPGNYQVNLDLGAGSIDTDIVNQPGAEYTIHVCTGAGSIDVHAYDPSRIDIGPY